MYLLCYSGDNDKQWIYTYLVKMRVLKDVFDAILGEVIDIEPMLINQLKHYLSIN